MSEILEGTNCFIKQVSRPPRHLRASRFSETNCTCSVNGQDPDCKCRLPGYDPVRAMLISNSYSIGGGNSSNSVVESVGGV